MRPILLAGCSAPIERRIARALGGRTQSRLFRWTQMLEKPGQVAAALAKDPAMVILGPDLSETAALRVAAEFDRLRPEVSVVLAADARPGLVDRALAVGARGVIEPMAADDIIRDTLLRALEAFERRMAARDTAEDAHVDARIITVAAPKGGSGKTMLAVNIAAALANIAPRQTVLVDLDLEFGDVSYALSLRPRNSIADAISPDVDMTALKVFLTQHPSELYALCAPEDPADGERVPAEVVTEIISRLAAEFQYVVVDTGAGLTEHTLAALDVSTDVVFVVDSDVPSVRHLMKVVDAMNRLGMHGHRRHFVLNRSDLRTGVDIREVTTGAGIHIDTEVPSSRHVPQALNQGVPIVLANPKSPVAKRIVGFVDRLIAGEANEKNQTKTVSWSAA